MLCLLLKQPIHGLYVQKVNPSNAFRSYNVFPHKVGKEEPQLDCFHNHMENYPILVYQYFLFLNIWNNTCKLCDIDLSVFVKGINFV